MSADTNSMSDEQIASIAQRMTEAGRTPTPLAVWGEVRSGSIVDVAAALQRWRESQAPQQVETEIRTGLPHGVAETLMNAAHQLWGASQDHSEQRFSQRMSAVNQRLDLTASERDEALAAYQAATQDVELARQQHQETAQSLQASHDAATQLRAHLADAGTRAEHAERRAEELQQRASTEGARLAATIASFEESQRSHEALSATLAAKDDEIARMAHERNEARMAHEALSASLPGKDEALARIAQERDALHAASSGKDEDIARLAHERDALTAALSAKDEEIARIAHEHEALNASSSGKDEAIARLCAERDEARQQAETLIRERDAKAEEADLHFNGAREAALRADAAQAQANEGTARIAALEAELQAAHGTLAEERRTHAAKHEEASAQGETLQRVTRELDESRARFAALGEQHEAARNEAAQRAQEAAAAKERAEAAERQSAAFEQRITEQEKREGEMRATHAAQRLELETRSVTVEGEIAALKRQIASQATDHTKAYDKLRTQAEEWVTYAKDLKQRLDASNEKLVFVDARSTGEVALMRRLALELERLKPDHELVLREAQQKLIGDKMVQQLAQKGYRYDPATSAISRIES